MIKNVALWEAWEREYARHDLPALDRNLLLLDALYEHACLLGALPLPNLLAGIDMKDSTGASCECSHNFSDQSQLAWNPATSRT